MKNARRKVGRLKRGIAWLLTVAIVAGNISQLSVMTSYGAEKKDYEAASTSSAGKATPSQATPSESRKVIDVKVTQSAIFKVLKKDFDNRPEFNEDLVPFEGEQKDLVIEKIYEELDGKTLILQKKTGKAMYLVVVADTLSGDPFSDNDPSDRIRKDAALQNVQIIGVNGYKDLDCQFRLRITGEDLVITDASIDEYAVVGENTEEETKLNTTSPGTAGNGSGSMNQTGKKQGTEAIVNPEETKKIEIGGSDANGTGANGAGADETGASGTGASGTGAGGKEANETGASGTGAGGTEANETGASGTGAGGTEANETGASGTGASGTGAGGTEANETGANGTGASKTDNSSSEANGSTKKGTETGETKANDTGQNKTGTDENRANKTQENESGAIKSENTGSEQTSKDKNGSKSDKTEINKQAEDNNSVSISKHQVPVLFEAQQITATSSEAEIEPEFQEAADLISLGETKVLSDEERESLMGMGDGVSLFSFLSEKSYDLVVRSFGITTLNSEISSEEKLTPYETALSYYGPDAEDKKDVVELHLSQSQTGTIKAGVLYTYTLTYTMQTAPIYEYAMGGKLPLFDLYEDAKIEFTVPKGIHIEEQEGKVKLISSGDGQNVYEIHVGDNNNEVRPGKLDSITVNAWIDGNGKRAEGELFSLPEDSVVFYAKVKVADRTDKEHVTYPGSIETSTVGEQPEDTALTLISEDTWHIKKRVYPNDNSYTVVRDGSGNPQYVDITYLIEMGMKGNSGDISRQPGGTIYQTYGRTGFEDNSFKITDSLSIKTENAPKEMKPVSVSAVWGDGKIVPVEEQEDGSIIIRDYKTQGQNTSGHIFVSEEAPTYSSYFVTARYPYEPFLLKYNDARISDSTVFTVSNRARLDYVKLGTTEKMWEESETDVAVHEVNQPAVIKIRKQIDEGVGTLKNYDKTMEKEYPGFAGFEIHALDQSGMEVPYENYTVIDRNGKKIDNRTIAVNPSAENGEDGLYATGDDGYIEILVDPGTYVIREEKKPTGTEFASAKAGSKLADKKPDITVTLKAGEKTEVTVVNQVIGKGSIEFYKKARIWGNDNSAGVNLYGLKGAEFTLYQKNPDGSLAEIKTVTSDDNGFVQFKPVTPGQYVVREKSANGYILDGKDYPVTVEAGVTSPVKTGDNTLINTLNQGRIRVTKLMQNDQGAYIPVPDRLRADFQDKFWFEQTSDGNTWTKVGTGLNVTYSLDGSSQFTAVLPVIGSDNREIRYRLAEEMPEGYSDGNPSEAGFYQETSNNKTHVYKEFTLSPLTAKELEVRNNKGGTITLHKESWSINSNEQLNKDATKQDYRFRLFSAAKNGGDFKEVNEGKVYTTDSNGIIGIKGLDVTRQYYWYEEGSTARLEAEDLEKMTEAVIDGTRQPVIGPFQLSREHDTDVKAYNLPQKVPYWLYKYDITNQNTSISAKFRITRQDTAQEVFSGSVTQKGKFILLDPGVTYTVEEVDAPKNYVKEDASAITTPAGPVTKKMLEEWFSSSKPLQKALYNKPYKEVNIKKIQYGADETKATNVKVSYEVFTKDENGFHRVENLSNNNYVVSNQYQPLAPGTYYFKEVVPNGVIDPVYLFSDKNDGSYTGYEINESKVYYGPFTITAATVSSEKKLDLYFNNGDQPFENYQNLGRVKVTKKDALKGTPVKDAVLGIFLKADFHEEDWQNSIKNPIQVETSSQNGEVVFDSQSLRIFDENGSRIQYVIAEITPPTGYLQSYEVLPTLLKEGKIITTENGDAQGKPLIITNEPKLTIRTQKYWQDGWNDQFYKINRVLGNVKLALYQVNKENPALADYVKTETTNAFDGIATFQDINRNDTYYVAEVRVPNRQETGFSFELNMGEREPLPLENGEPAKTLEVKNLESLYNAVKYTGKDLTNTADSLVQNTDPIYNYRSWVQFHVLKICNGILPDGKTHEPEKVNGARFTLYKMLEDNKNLSSVQLSDLEDGSRFEAVDQYESGTRIDPKTGVRADGEFDTAILEAGKVYWLVEDEAADGYILPSGRQIVAVFAPKDGGYTGQKSIFHPYENGRNDRIAEIVNIHGEGPHGLARYHFQIALNKWLKADSAGTEPTLLGGARFRIWLLDPVTKEKLLSVDEVETGLESDQTYKTGYGLSKVIKLDVLSQQLTEKKLDPEQILDIDKEKNLVKATFALEEISAPSKVNLDPTLHYLTVTIPQDLDYVDDQYFWDKTKPQSYRLINTLSSEYPVTLVKYGYVPDSDTFGKTDSALDGMNIIRTPLSGVKFELWQYQWNGSGYAYKQLKTYTTKENGRIVIPGGLSSGRYRIKEVLTSKQQEKYLTMYSGENGLYRYFTVGSSPITVNVYNPEKPDLEIEKTAWNGEKPEGLEGIRFTVQRDGGGEATASVEKQEDGRYAARFKGLDSGRYTVIKEELSTSASKLVTDKYFDQLSFFIGYSPKANGEEVALWPTDSSVTGNVIYMTVKNPRLSDLVIHKTDHETKRSDSNLKGASFQVEYLKFRPETDLLNGQLQNVEDPDYPKPDQGFSLVKEVLKDQGDGSYVLKNGAPGWYKITETKAPSGYSLDSQPYVVAVTGDMGAIYQQTSVSIENRKKAELTVTKTLVFGEGFKQDDDLKEKLPKEIVFDVYTYSENAYKQVVDEDGKPVRITIDHFTAADGLYTGSQTIRLPQNPSGGAYYLREQENPDWMLAADGAVENGILYADGYMQAGGAEDFTSSNPVSVTVKNRYAKSRVVITKVDGADPSKSLSGGAFQLYEDAELKNKVADFKEIEKTGVYEAVFSTKTYPDGQYFVKEVSAPAGYIGIDTAFPEGGLIAETGKTTEITMPNQSGVDLRITKYSGNGGTEALKSGITFELYKKSVSGEWNYVSEATTDGSGKLSYLGLMLSPGEAYGISEVIHKQQGFPDYRMEALEGEKGTIPSTFTDVVKDGEVRSGQELYVLTDESTILPGVYEFKAHNQEAIPLKLLKNDVNRQENPDAFIKTIMKVTDKNTGIQIGELVLVPYGETGTSISLLPGTYVIEETEVSENSQGYIINRDDERTVYQKEVTIEKGKTPSPVEFTNVKQKTDVTLDKTSLTTELKDLWWNDGQTVTYTITPHVINTIPLDGFVLKDTGLTMLDKGKSVLPESDYTYEKYTITSIKPGKSTEQNRIKGGKTGTILADVTFYDFDGNQVGNMQTVKVSGDGEIGLIKPVSGKNIKSFQISYRDDALKNSTKQNYVLGQEFNPGSVEVTVKLNRQDAKLPNGNYKEEIKYINNQADAVMTYRKWDRTGTLSQTAEQIEKTSAFRIPVVQSQAPVISAEKNVTPVKEAQPGDTLTYTLTVRNETKSDDPAIVPMRKPVLIDYIPEGVTVSGESEGENRILKAVRIANGPAGVAIEKTTKKVDPQTGRETLFIVLSGELKRGDSVTVEVKAQISGNIISYGKNILNKLYVTSDVVQPPFSLNKTGASFMIETKTGDQWPSADLPDGVLLPDEKYRNYGYVSDSAENSMNTGTGLLLYKEVMGNLDTRFVSGTTAGRVAKTIDGAGDTSYDGSVRYRLTVNNDSKTNYVTQLQLMDILPAKGDLNTDSNNRLSDYRLRFEHIESISIENRKDDGTSGRKLSDFQYEVTYADQAFDNKGTVKEAKSGVINDNSNGFWSGSSGDPTAFRIKLTDKDFYLAPGENLVVTYKTTVPYTTAKELDEAAYGYAVNDFAVTYSYREGGLSGNEKATGQIQNSNCPQVLLVPGDVKVSGRIFIDENNSGIQKGDASQDHLLTDLLPVLQSGYFKVSLLKYGKNGDDEVTGAIGTDARFTFGGLTPAKPFGIVGTEFTEDQEESWYRSQSLEVSKLKGDDPAHYRIYMANGTMPTGYEDLILKLTKPFMKQDGENEKPGRSRLPQTLIPGGANYEESLDSNFKEGKDGFSSEDFFLWSTSGGYDTTKDIGFVPYRNVTVKKTDTGKNPVEGVRFSLYGPFTNEEMDAYNKNGITDPAELPAPSAQGSTVLTDGEAIWNAGELLYYRNYIVVEDNAPDGFQMEQADSSDMEPMASYQVSGQKAWILKSKEFKTAQNQIPSTVTVTNHYITGSLEFTKADEVTGSGLSGAAFMLQKKSDVREHAWNAFVATLKANEQAMGVTKVETTDQGVVFETVSGKVSLTGIPYGSYTLSEIRVPEGYDITKKQVDLDFTINTDGQKVVLDGLTGNVITNARTEYSLTLKKTDNTGNDQVAGIKFSIQGPGSYEGKSWIPFSKDRFRLKDPAKDGYEVKETDAKGLITWNLPYGDYEIKELEAAGYESIEPFYVRLDADGTVSLLHGEDRRELTLTGRNQKEINVTVENTVKTGPLIIEKVDEETHSAIFGAQFELSGTSLIPGAFKAYQEQVTGLGISNVTTGEEDGKRYIRFQVDGSGNETYGRLTQIPYGSYALKEIKSPDGYLLEPGKDWKKEFQLEHENGIDFTGEDGVLNLPHKLTIEKQDKVTKKVLAGAEFVLMAANGRYVSLDSDYSYAGLKDQMDESTHFITGINGKAVVKRLPAGDYILKEIKAPDQYALSEDTPITVLSSGNSEVVTVYDVRNKAQIKLIKAAAHDPERTLKGAEFEIYSNESLSSLAGTLITGDDGIGVSQMLPLGTYYVKESKAPGGYERSDRIYPITLKEDQEAYILQADENDFIVNDYGTGSLLFDKVDQETGKPLAAARFSLTKKKTEVEGAFSHFGSNLLTLSQKDLENMGISDLVVQEDKIVFDAVNGHVELNKIPYGTYTLKEEKAPEGYLSLNGKAEFDFSLTEGQKEASLGNNNVIVNERAQFEIRLRKTDDLGRTISGMQFRILGPGRYEEDGILSIFGADRFHADQDSGTGIFTTGADGMIKLGLKHGDYQIKELSTDRYDPIDPFYIRVDKDGSISILKDPSGKVGVSKEDLLTLVVTNQISTGKLELEKTDSENKSLRLDGAEFTLTNLNTLVPGAWDSYRNLAASEGAAWSLDKVNGNNISFVLHEKGVIENLPYGTYRLTESKAPEGYVLGTQPWTREFTIDRESREILYTAPGLFEKTEGPIENVPSAITVVKTNAVLADVRLKGAEFMVKASDGRYVTFEQGSFTGYTADKAAAGTLVTGEDGQFVLKRLPRDAYTFIETKAPSGYYINHSIAPVTLDGVNRFTITIQDERITGGGGDDDSNTPGTPGTPGTSVTIVPDPVPLANLPTDQTVDLLQVDDGNVPLAKLPKTGERKNNTGKVMVALSGFMMALYAALSKKKREN